MLVRDAPRVEVKLDLSRTEEVAVQVDAIDVDREGLRHAAD
jgi:hypothetical protein